MGSAGAGAHQPDFEIGDARAQRCGRAQENFHTLAPIETADEEDSEARMLDGLLLGQEPAPLGEIDEFGDYSRGLSKIVEFPRAFGRVPAGGEDERGALDVEALAASLHAHGETGESRFEAHFIGDYAFERGDVIRRGGDAIAIHVETDGEIVGRGGAQGAIEEQPLERVNGQAHAGSFEIHLVPEGLEGARQYVNSDVGAAAAANIERSGSEEANSQWATIIV